MSVLRPLLLAALLGGAQAAPAGYVLSGMPLVHQTYNACGPASITQVLGYFGINVSLSDVSRLTRPTERSYMTAQAIVDFAPKVGMEARLYRGGSLQTVRAAIRARLPLIALQSHITATQVIPHWRVVTGYDDTRREVYLMDPLLGYVLMSYADFTRVWADHQGEFAVMYPPEWRGTVRKVIG
ncbi:peptidase C39, bacteriocin processing [Deinococcus aerius]|uniref:Peptidase C39, bacteriocin processing n=1 Tax=Deinococcus aerius TaxID=200253 RepID=A0A2I9CUU5_9DEIO|nr:C39 family peptidase [Deinococcus aerius]GBF05642.1 peptidase C39, bacteriocin processing [Deinococcus aerius]